MVSHHIIGRGNPDGFLRKAERYPYIRVIGIYEVSCYHDAIRPTLG